MTKQAAHAESARPRRCASARLTTAAPWRRRVAGGAALLGGLLLLLSMLAPWFDGGTYSDNAPEQIAAIGIRAVLALAAGAAAFVPRVSTPVAVAFLAAAGAAAGAGSLTMVGVLRDYSLDRLDAGWWMALGGQLLVGAAGLGAVLVAPRAPRCCSSGSTSARPGALVALCVGLFTTVLFVAYTVYLAPLSAYWAAVALVVGPADPGRHRVRGAPRSPHRTSAPRRLGRGHPQLLGVRVDLHQQAHVDPHAIPRLVLAGVVLLLAAPGSGPGRARAHPPPPRDREARRPRPRRTRSFWWSQGDSNP